MATERALRARESATAPRQANEGHGRGYTAPEVEIVRDAIEDHHIETIPGIVKWARTLGGNFIVGTTISAMCRDGLFGREGDRLWVLDESSEAAASNG